MLTVTIARLMAASIGKKLRLGLSTALSLLDVGSRTVSRGSSAYGEPFLELFARAGNDFYAVDPTLFAPATVHFVNVETGRTHRFGGVAPEIVARSFGPARPAPAGA